MESYKIIGIEKTYISYPISKFSGFYLENVVGSVDIFVEGNFMPDCLKQFLDKKDCVIVGKEIEFIKKELEWANDQIGKYLTCDSLMFKAFATKGEVNID